MAWFEIAYFQVTARTVIGLAYDLSVGGFFVERSDSGLHSEPQHLEPVRMRLAREQFRGTLVDAFGVLTA